MAFGQQGEGSTIGKLVAKNTKQVEGRPIFTIEGKTFEIRKMSHMQVFDLLPLLGDLLIVPLAYGLSPSSAENIEDSEDFMDEVALTDNLPDMVALLFTKLREAPVKELVAELLTCVYVKGENQPVNPDKDFEEAADIVTALTEVVKVHYTPFMKLAFKGEMLSSLAMVANLKNSLK
jgi:hypothetical protein